MSRENHSLYVLNIDASSLDLWDALDERLSKANSLVQFALTESIVEHLSNDVRHYLWALSQFIQEACEINCVLQPLSVRNKIKE